jgi:hypothetical protein
MKFLLWVIRAKNLSRDETLAGLEGQPQSEEKNAIMTYFGSDQLVSQFQQLFPESPGRSFIPDTPKKLAGFLPSLGACADPMFACILQCPQWSLIIAGLQKATSESDLAVIDKLFDILADRGRLESLFHHIVIGVVLGDAKSVTGKTLMRFARHFSIVADHLTAGDIEPIHGRVDKLLQGAHPKEAEEALGFLLPPLLNLVKREKIEGKLALSDRAVIQALSQRPALKIVRVLTNYVLVCAGLNPKFLDSIQKAANEAVKSKLNPQQAIPALIVLALGLVIVREKEICQGLMAIFGPLQPNATGQILEECFAFFRTAGFEGGRKDWVSPLAVALFREAKLSVTEEKEFFEMALSGFTDESAREIVKVAVEKMEKWTARKDREAMIAAKRVVFLIGKWPERAAEIRAKIPQGMIASFTSKTAEWPGIVVALNG